MSNNAVGQLYKRIIDQVIEASRTDFEENGVDSRMIGTLEKTWQDHLTAKHAATFPWDPAPTAPDQAAEAPAAPVKAQPATNPPSSAAPQQSPVNVKQEPGTGFDPAFTNYPPAGGAYTSNPNLAEQRAQHLVQARYANQAQGINSLGNIHLPGQQSGQQRPGYQFSTPAFPQQQQQQQRPGQPATNGQANWQPQQQQSAAQHNAAPQIKQERDDAVGISQTDGAADEPDSPDSRAQWSSVMTIRNAAENDGPTGRRAVDRMIRRHVASNLRAMEGGGLLVPLDERYSPISLKQRPSSRASSSRHPRNPPRFDGAEEDGVKEEDDADAINSDLDDSEDEAGDAMVGEDYVGDMIICLYDKVQRVKNKWKCTLKDGVVNVDGKDYVFHKANGEFEW